MARPSGTGLPEESRATLSRILRLICDRDFAGSVSRMAKSWEMDQSPLNAVVNNTAGAGISTLLQLREKTGLSLETLLGLELHAVHVIRDEKIRLELTTQPGDAPVESIAEDFERLQPAKAPSAPPKMRSVSRPKPKTV